MHRANVDPPKRKVVGEVGIEPTVTREGADLQSAVTQPIVTSLQKVVPHARIKLASSP